VTGWAGALRSAGVQRVIWVQNAGVTGEAVAAAVPLFVEVETGNRSPSEIAAEVAHLDDAAEV
jgi:hypothetical protein